MSSFASLLIIIIFMIINGQSILCDGNTTICHNITIYCPITHSLNCSITCVNPFSCANSIVMAKSIESLDLQCIRPNACDSIIVYGPNITNSYFRLLSNSYEATKDAVINVDDTQNVRFECVGAYSCLRMKIYAQRAQSFDGYFTRLDAFRDGELYASNISTMTILCSWTSACQNITLYANYVESIDIECDDNACKQSNIDMSFVTYASINCQRCQNANIYGLNAQQIQLTCTNSVSCNQTALYCPSSHDSLCWITCQQSASCSRLAIYKIDGYDISNDNLQIECNRNNDCNGATIFCTEYLNHSCQLTKNMNSLQCISDKDSVCGITLDPTLAPTIPTYEPSVQPTILTMYPSLSPSSAPIIITKIPTTIPTINNINAGVNTDKDESGLGQLETNLIIMAVVILCCGCLTILFYIGYCKQLGIASFIYFKV